MSNSVNENQEIDLGKVFTNFSSSIKGLFIGFLAFLLKNKLILLLLFIIGFALGYYLDAKPTYKNELILKPNFNTADYLYAKTEQFNSFKSMNEDNILEGKYNLKKRKELGNFKIEPINDIYRFLKDNESGYNFLKLMAEDGSIKKIIDEDVTSKNYEYHKVTFESKEFLTKEEVVEPFMKFINDDEYLLKLHEINLKNTEKKANANDSIVKQIDQVFKKFGTQSSTGSISISGENVPLDNLMYIKDKLIYENNYFELVRQQASSMIKDHAIVLNIKDTKGLNGKKKFVLPIILIVFFILFSSIRKFYQMNKSKLN